MSVGDMKIPNDDIFLADTDYSDMRRDVGRMYCCLAA